MNGPYIDERDSGGGLRRAAMTMGMMRKHSIKSVPQPKLTRNHFVKSHKNSSDSTVHLSRKSIHAFRQRQVGALELVS